MLALLYGEKPETDAISVLVYADAFAKDAGVLGSLDVDVSKVVSLLRAIRQDFPHKDGLEQASVFKKVANFVVYFVAESPIVSSFPPDSLRPTLLKLKNHQNAVIALEIAIDALHGAVIRRNGHPEVVLKNRIEVSKHSYDDIVEALCETSPSLHFKLVCVLLEQLAYRANPEASYPLQGSDRPDAG